MSDTKERYGKCAGCDAPRTRAESAASLTHCLACIKADAASLCQWCDCHRAVPPSPFCSTVCANEARIHPTEVTPARDSSQATVGPMCTRCGRTAHWHPDGSCHVFGAPEDTVATEPRWLARAWKLKAKQYLRAARLEWERHARLRESERESRNAARATSRLVDLREGEIEELRAELAVLRVPGQSYFTKLEWRVLEMEATRRHGQVVEIDGQRVGTSTNIFASIAAKIAAMLPPEVLTDGR